jgi:glycosyltransferase involved in cell wall biosynthesis
MRIEMNHHPLVSVIIIFLNAENFIQEAIDSVFAQTYNQWELLLVDDGSTDESSSIARKVAEQYPGKVRYLEHTGHQNLGMSVARNLGISHSTGDLIAFLDADDAWFPYTLQEQVAILQAQPEADMVYGPLYWWYSWTGLPEDQDRDYIEKLGVPSNSLIEPPGLLPLFLLDKAAVPSGMLVRREAIDRVGWFENAFRGEYEDQVFCAKVCLNLPVFAAGRPWYRYRQHPGSSVSVGLSTGQTRHARLVFLNWLARYVCEQGNNDPSVWRALRHEFWRVKYPRQYRTVNRIKDFAQRVNQRWSRMRTGLTR